MKLISAFGAADMLELDRQTVRRALRHVRPDGHENKQPRWRLKTIIDAVDRHFGRNSAAVAPTATAALDALFEAFDTGCKRLDGLPDLEARRREARRLMAALVDLDAAMRSGARACREDELRAALRCDEHFRIAMRNFERPCGWTQEQCWALLTEGAEQ
ncbi:hypothetical protein FBZ93_10349 [Bradyrhizobium macuxiense]|uniref:Uncharacterized protein n=1 Tax=Bradyrhizobium macuxiense TaxID=1755647 RepID=A0A560MBP1_9BRAD|nr:hypothetical protein [Bradyrhizobium macuxiense]TWC05039.1 hypothetical protein FBZ93_10349 [Bradyrhizobium macuxiense]